LEWPAQAKVQQENFLLKKLNYIFIDTDEIIAEKESLEIHEIIKKVGEKSFTNIEEKYVLGLGDIKDSIISPGGSVIYSNKSMNFLKEKSIIVFLDAPYTKIEQRLRKRKHLSIIGLRQKGLKKLFSERLKQYRKYADITVRIENKTSEKIVQEILDLVKH
jgi:shikimate kinase